MRKNFNSVQMLETSEVCNKFSTSVSYETLVGGTATIYTDIKQTQRLSEGSADKPLTAVGTLTSLLCNSAKVVEKLLRHVITRRTLVRRGYLPEKCTHANKESLFASVTCFRRLPRRIQRMLLVITIPVLALLFTFITTAESWADEETPVCKEGNGKTVTCIEKLADKNGNNSCGDNCTYKVIVENGKQVLHIYKEDISKPASIRAGAFSPYYYADNQVKDAQNKAISLQNIVFDNDFETIGRYAFTGSRAQIFSANGKFVFQDTENYIAQTAKTGRSTFNGDILFIKNPHTTVLENTNIKGDIIFAEGLSKINDLSLMGAHIDGNIIIPSSIKQIGDRALSSSSITGQIYCASGVEACYDMVKAGCLSQLEATRRTTCLDSLESLYNSNKLSAYPDGCLSMGAKARCTKCKSASFKLEDDGWCLRKIYTPAEAAEVLNDDNNEITITFKK